MVDSISREGLIVFDKIANCNPAKIRKPEFARFRLKFYGYFEFYCIYFRFRWVKNLTFLWHETSIYFRCLDLWVESVPRRETILNWRNHLSNLVWLPNHRYLTLHTILDNVWRSWLLSELLHQAVPRVYRRLIPVFWKFKMRKKTLLQAFTMKILLKIKAGSNKNDW